MQAFRRRQLSSEAANIRQDREFRRRGSMIVLKAFPLEFEGVGPAALGKRVLRRTCAPVRLYEPPLGVGRQGRARGLDVVCVTIAA